VANKLWKGDGAGCRCGAHGRNECGCPNADWTPSEVYRIRDLNIALLAKQFVMQTKIDNLKKYLDAKDELLACYRLGKRPSETLLNKLEKLNKLIGESNG